MRFVRILLALLAVSSVSQAKAPTLPFSYDLADTLVLAEGTGKPVVVVFVAAWCPICREMKQGALRDPSVLALADEFHWVMVDIDRNITVARENAVEGVPLVRILDSRGAEVVQMIGLQEPLALRDRLSGLLQSFHSPTEPRSREIESGDVGRKSALIWRPNGYRGAGVCFSHVGYGPLNLYSQSPFQSFRLVMRPRTPSTLVRGEFEVRANSTWVNVWGLDKEIGDPTNEFFLDVEMLQTTVALAYGMSDTFQVEGEIQNRSRFGGHLDGFIQGFHDLFGIDQNGREEVPQGEFFVQLNPPGGASVELNGDDDGNYSRTVQLSAEHNLTCGTNKSPAVSYAVSARLETLDVGDLTGGPDLDLGVSLAVAQRFGRCHIYGTLGYAWFGRDNFRGIELKDTQFSALLAAELRLRDKHSLLVQYLRTGGLIAGFGPFAASSNELTFGYKWEMREKGILEVGLIENVGTFDNSPDFGLHLGVSQRF